MRAADGPTLAQGAVEATSVVVGRHPEGRRADHRVPEEALAKVRRGATGRRRGHADRLRDMYRFFKALPRGRARLVWQPAASWEDKLVGRVCADLGLLLAGLLPLAAMAQEAIVSERGAVPITGTILPMVAPMAVPAGPNAEPRTAPPIVPAMERTERTDIRQAPDRPRRCGWTPARRA